MGGPPPFPDNDDGNDDIYKDAYVKEGSAAALLSASTDGDAAALPSLTYASRTIRMRGGGEFNAMMKMTMTRTPWR